VPVVAAAALAQPEPRPLPAPSLLAPSPPVAPAPAPVTAPPVAVGEFDNPGAQRAKLQADLEALIRAINARSATGPTVAPPKKPDYPPPDLSKSVDQVREGMNLFRDGSFVAARRVFSEVDPTTLNREDQVFVRYMLACSHRRLNNVTEAETIYREVANNSASEFLANCAISQLALLRSNQDLETLLEQLRSRAKSK
jgi:hypothetical protein